MLTSFLVSLSFGVTQTPLVYVFGVMTCDEYYRHHDLPPLGTPAYNNRCHIHAIEASTARAVALLGASTTFFGVANLFVIGWAIKMFGIKPSLMITIIWPAVRLLVQSLGIMTGAGTGILITQLSQVTTIVGGPVGYMLALTSYATEIVRPSERTATLGRLSGVAMAGSALGFFAGGQLEEIFSDILPFQTGFVLFCLTSLYTYLFLPSIPISHQIEKRANKSLSSFFDPLKMFTPVKWVLRDGKVQKEFGVLLLGIGAFLAVFATGYIITLLQMYATDVFDYGRSDVSNLIAFNFTIRACFLTFAFPKIISTGRRWLDEGKEHGGAAEPETTAGRDESSTQAAASQPEQLNAKALPVGHTRVEEVDSPLKRTTTGNSTIAEQNQSYAFDLFYARYSLILDGFLTGLATFTTRGWHMYVVAFVIPLAAGTGSASKGVMLQMCPPDQKVDALSAISLVELAGRLSSTSIFGLVFSAFAQAGQPQLTFAVNGGMALVGFIVLLCARFPPEGAVRYEKDSHGNIHDNSIA